MNVLDDFRAVWQSVSDPPPTLSPDRLAGLKADADRLDRTLRWRDAREIGGAAVVAFLFGRHLDGPPELRLGAAIVVASAIWITAVLLITRLRHPRPRPGDSVRRALVLDRDRFGAQEALLRWAWLWYVLPIWVGMLLFMGGTLSTLPGWLGLVGATLVAVGIGWLNRWSARRDLAPTRDAAAALLDDLDDALSSPDLP